MKGVEIRTALWLRGSALALCLAAIAHYLWKTNTMQNDLNIMSNYMPYGLDGLPLI